MGKKEKSYQLGRAIIKDRFGKGKGKNRRGDPTMARTIFCLFVILSRLFNATVL